MRLSTRGRYGVSAMLDLALQKGAGPVSIKSISARQGISTNYLEQLFNKLRRAGLIDAARGPKGGVFLKKAPKNIRIIDILSNVKEPLEPVYCLDKPGNGHNCRRISECVPRMLWQRLSDKIRECLEETTLEDLAEEANRR